MKKLNVLVMGLLLPMLAVAQTVKSPNGNVSVTFSLTEKGQPTYEMSYKGKAIIPLTGFLVIMIHRSMTTILLL